MVSNINTIAKNEVKTLFKEKTFILILVIFILMTLLSNYIGWSSRTTIENVFQETIKKVVSSGSRQIPVDPFTGISILSIIKNMIVYIFLIGSLLAIIIGYNSFLRERLSGVSKIIFSKPIERKEFILGKIYGILFLLLLITITSFLISLISISLITGKILSLQLVVKLIIFYFLSLIYMFLFSIIGLFFSIFAKSSSLALMIPVIIWIFISFVLPELTSALNPTALLNPANIQSTLPHGKVLIFLQEILKPFSVSDTYKVISGSLLELDSTGSSTSALNILINNSAGFIFMIALLGAAIFGSYYTMLKFDATEEEIYE
ncbi:MAG: ABC transporter permease [Actinobacteria bacterium]|nr:ABC transporter permease [Cyanobacteriota bacterium]MCL5772540.1 ABC transporter permease [Actinomycetota bacterium]